MRYPRTGVRGVQRDGVGVHIEEEIVIIEKPVQAAEHRKGRSVEGRDIENLPNIGAERRHARGKSSGPTQNARLKAGGQDSDLVGDGGSDGEIDRRRVRTQVGPKGPRGRRRAG